MVQVLRRWSRDFGVRAEDGREVELEARYSVQYRCHRSRLAGRPGEVEGQGTKGRARGEGRDC